VAKNSRPYGFTNTFRVFFKKYSANNLPVNP
jgi:hypothetical protein